MKKLTIREELNDLRDIVKSLAASVVKHDDQIEALLKIAEKQQAQLSSIERQWQAYVRSLPRQ